MRGLKHTYKIIHQNRPQVASFTDAWIETELRCLKQDVGMSHLLQMRGLKHNRTVSYITYLRSHLLQMRGLKLSSNHKKQNH